MNDPQPEGHMASHIGRRKFLATFGGAAVAWPLATRAQQGERVRRIGVLMNTTADVLSFPGESHAEWTRYRPNWESRTALRYAGKLGNDLECQTRSPVSWVFRSFDRLYLPRVDVVDDEALKKIEEHTKSAGERDYQGERTRLLRERDFNCADFSEFADLRRVDFTNTSLRGALFELSKLQGASLADAQLQGASLANAQLQGAYLIAAHLQGASLNYAQLQGADLQGAQLQGADLDHAQLQGASLADAQLQGANLQGAQLQGARLHGAELQGADLDYAQLQGASLANAQLQGASLSVATLTGSALLSAAVWRARNASCRDAHVQDSKYDPIIRFHPGPNNSVHATPEAAAKFIDDAVIGISDP
jgi:uncharacterized protein YjbI with pentapeptide repeats